MRNFHLTGKNFEGFIEVSYDDADVLSRVDFSACNLDVEARKKAFNFLPMTIAEVKQKNWGAFLEFIEVDFEITFAQFWQRYNKKVNKVRAEKVWQKLSKKEQIDAVYKLYKYELYLSRNTWRGKLDPDTYLRNKAWQSEWQ